jgi:hypothetical protein
MLKSSGVGASGPSRSGTPDEPRPPLIIYLNLTLLRILHIPPHLGVAYGVSAACLRRIFCGIAASVAVQTPCASSPEGLGPMT